MGKAHYSQPHSHPTPCSQELALEIYLDLCPYFTPHPATTPCFDPQLYLFTKQYNPLYPQNRFLIATSLCRLQEVPSNPL